MLSRGIGQPYKMCASETISYRKGADNLEESGLPEETVVSGFGLLGDAAVVLLAEDRAKQYDTAARNERDLAEQFRERVAERAAISDPRIIGFLPGDLRSIITESLEQQTT